MGWREMSNDLFLKTMCQFLFSLSVSMSFDLYWFVFVGLFFYYFIFLRLSFIQIFSLVVLSFYHFEGSFHF